MRIPVVAMAVTLSLASPALATAQSAAARTQAKIPYGIGFEHMRSEAWEQAATAFQRAVDLDPEFELAYYMLGRANMALKKYVSATAAYLKCRDLFLDQAGRRFSNAQEAQRYRNDRVTELDELIRQLQTGRQSMQTAEQLRQVQEQKRQIQEAISRGSSGSIGVAVPSWVSLALGSALFRSGKLADAEREYKEAISADSRSGEAHNNLAVVFLETGRLAEAEASVRAAKKAGFRVNPQLEQDIKDRQKPR